MLSIQRMLVHLHSHYYFPIVYNGINCSDAADEPVSFGWRYMMANCLSSYLMWFIKINQLVRITGMKSDISFNP